jgi:hypothetical protein
MIALTELENRLGYDASPHYHRLEEPAPNIETAHLFRAAQEIGVHAIYAFESSPGQKQKLLPARPAVYVAEAETLDEARRIHRSLWNQCYTPFLIIRLPEQIRIYTGFSYAEKSEKQSLLAEIDEERLSQLHDILTDFSAASIDTGQLWKSKYAEKQDAKQRVNEHLLQNLKKLGKVLIDDGLCDETAHALIGKYVYLHYLRDRQILSDAWLHQKGIDPNSVFKRHATIEGLQRLTEALAERFNGRIFPIDFDDKESQLADKHVSWVASVFMGDEFIEDTPRALRQLHLPFRAYDFHYIPVETLSAIYEQFIYKSKKKGAIYTPEFLADYLLSEVEAHKELERGMKILDPACGSGVFLVLAYRRLIEKELARLKRKLTPEELREILLESIYGVERERDACYVAEFGLILTLLHYIEPRELQNLNLKLPELHNERIFQCDFFDLEGKEGEGKFWQKGITFDLIVGNPPWIRASTDEKLVRTWIERYKKTCPVADNRVAEAFSWLVTDLLTSDGIVGLILPATSLVNVNSQDYRSDFFKQHEVLRVTNFSNLREILFGAGGKSPRSTMPASTIVYRRAEDTRDKPYILHYAPFCVNQVYGTPGNLWMWTMTINENEIQTISPYEAEKGETSLWKLALWGTHRDRRTLERIEYLLPKTLSEICEKRNWKFRQGVPLRRKNQGNDALEHDPELKGTKRFDTDLMQKSSLRFSVSPTVLQDIPDENCYIRKGRRAGLHLTRAPHLILSADWRNYIIYSSQDFVIPPRQMGIGASKADADYLRSLAVYLCSSHVGYYLFFHVPQWGSGRHGKRVVKSQVEKIPTPEFTPELIQELATFQKELVELEKQKVKSFESNPLAGDRGQFLSELRADLQNRIDDKIFDLFNIPDDIHLIVEDFIHARLLLDTPSKYERITRAPTDTELLAYARELRDELDDFVMGTSYHKVTTHYSSELIECIVEITQKDAPIPVNAESVKSGGLTMTQLHAALKDQLTKQHSQWVYVQRGLRLFDGPRIHIYKPPRLIDWTRTQALNDASDIIGEVVSATWRNDENQYT